MPIPAGRFNRIIEIWRDVPGDENGLGERPVVPTKIATLRASKDFLTREERLAAAQETPTEASKFTIRYSALAASITNTDRVRFGGLDFNITAHQEYGYREAIDLYVSAVVTEFNPDV